MDAKKKEVVFSKPFYPTNDINKDFELVGLAFDGMIETIISDYKYIPEARTISVDSRYLLWNLEKVAEAKNILAEIDIVR